jgi:CRISPR-associated endonuclease/helicase Cas3
LLVNKIEPFELNHIFKKLLGNEKASLYSYQEKVAEHLLCAGRNVILRAPTGAGKTWAALLPYLYARKFDLPFVDKVIYALPLRSLASQLYQSTAGACENNAEELNAVAVKIQTGEQQDDPFFQGGIIFTTIDQLLSSYLLSPVSLPRRLANINAGALPGSLIVFDEFHLLDPGRSMGTALEMLERLNGLCRFVLMTATLSDEAVSFLGKRLQNTVIVDLSATEIEAIEGQKDVPTTRVWCYHDQPMTAEDVLAQNHDGRTLVLTNTVSRAQQIYRQITDLLKQRQSPTEAVLLHSRFFPADRSVKEKLINERLGKESRFQKVSFILVSTQVVEAGMDFSVDCLHSELAPINSLIQRAGRCARYGGSGTVDIYPVENYRPYEIAMDETAAFLTARQGDTFTYAHEREAINQILGNHEKGVVAQYDNMSQRRNKVNLSMDGLLPGARDELIRDINSVSVLLTSAPEIIHFDRSGGAPEMLSVPLGTLSSFLAKAAAIADGQWVARMPFADQAGDDETRFYRFKWQTLDPKLLPGAWLIALNPAFTRYTSDLGLQLGEVGQEIPITYNKQRFSSRYGYRRETFADHNRLVLKYHRRLMQQNRHAVALLAAKFGLSVEDVERAVLYAILLHDIGKLTTCWQGGAKKWQKYKDPCADLFEPLAHTDFDPAEDCELQRPFPRRPNHAVEGAYAVCDYLNGAFDGKPELAACIYTAIARHHSGHGAKLGHFNLIPDAVAVVNGLLHEAGLPPADTLLDKPDPLVCGAQGEFAGDLLQASREEDRPWLPLYFFVVRQLRLADQAGSAEGGEPCNM